MRHLEIYVHGLLASIILTTMVSCSILGSSGSNDGPKLKGIPGQIVYSARQGEQRHLFIIDHEGTRQLTSSEGIDSQRDYYASTPSFSPDGKWVVYTSNQGSTYGQKMLYMVRSDGSDKKPIKDERGNLIVGGNPVFSPDGRQVAFNRPESKEPYYKNEDIYIVDLDGGKVHKLTQNTAHDTNPTWSPDGTKIAFSSERNYENADTLRFRKDLYVINTDGTDLQRLTQTGNATCPKWSPEGHTIAYEWNIQGNKVFIYNIRSGQIKKLETGLEFSGNAIWDHKGEKILISGRKEKRSEPEVRLLNIEKEPPATLQNRNLEKLSGQYDWSIQY